MQKRSSLDARCYELLATIPKGKVVTYKTLAHALGTKAYRAVGNALSRNKNLINIPCHRVVKSDASIGGYVLGTQTKIALLRDEGIEIEKEKVKDLKRYLYDFGSR